MGRKITIWSAVLALLLGGCDPVSLPAGGPGSLATIVSVQPPPPPPTKRELIVAAAIKEIGDVETEGNNRGPGPKKFLASVGLGEGYPYCGGGIYYCYLQGGDTILPARQFALAAKWHPKARRIFGKGALIDTIPIRPADVTGHLIGGMDGIHHVNLVVIDRGKYVDIIGFNTTDGTQRDGTGVYRKTLLKAQVYCISSWIE